jgi:hypothetical protein
MLCIYKHRIHINCEGLLIPDFESHPIIILFKSVSLPLTRFIGKKRRPQMLRESNQSKRRENGAMEEVSEENGPGQSKGRSEQAPND